MLVGGEGRLRGTVGGGCVEADVIRAALDAQTAGVPLLVTHHLNADLAGDLGLSCGGTVEVFVEPLVADPRYIAALEQAGAAEGEGRGGGGGGIVTTAVSWADGPFKHFESLPPDASADGAPAALSSDRRFVIERLAPAPRVMVFGAGHVGAAIARAADAAGFRVVLVDDRPEFADPVLFPDRMTVWAASVHAAVAQAAITPADAIVVATRGHRHDAVILERVAASPAGYVGLLGSRRKQAVITKALSAAGVPVQSLARVRVPVGLAIGAVTPEEIAVSVVAELIAWRRNRERGMGTGER